MLFCNFGKFENILVLARYYKTNKSKFHAFVLSTLTTHYAPFLYILYTLAHEIENFRKALALLKNF